MTDPGVRLGRRSATMAAGTVLSRATGFGRVLALAYALGFNRLSDAYNLANTMPNIVYELVLGGVVSATVVPVFVGLFEGGPDGRGDEDPWRGVAAVTTIVLAVTAGLSVLFAVAAPLLIAPVHRAQRHGDGGRAAASGRRPDAVLRPAGRVARRHGARLRHPQRPPALRRADVRSGAQQRRRHRRARLAPARHARRRHPHARPRPGPDPARARDDRRLRRAAARTLALASGGGGPLAPGVGSRPSRGARRRPSLRLDRGLRRRQPGGVRGDRRACEPAER